MRVFTRYRSRWLTPILVLLAVLQLAACGDKEGDQRKAFIEFLQSSPVQSGGPLPALSTDQKQRFGPYVNDYAILTTFSQHLQQSVASSLNPLLEQVKQIRLPQDYVTQRDNLRQLNGSLNLLSQQIQSSKMQADTARQALKQPEDLQVVYQRLYTRVVTQPTEALLPAIPQATAFAQNLVQVGDYLQAQGDQVVFNGASVQFRTQQQVNQYNGLVSGLAAQQQSLANALRNQNLQQSGLVAP
ncbi:DUF3053 domain-containing protein [Affinibrenneria salicis]|uniref:DUF3053 domain-containing protein n=1 Tax=Affinibrenneria salicis TaxID=2590031 RepID=A0A5J5FUK8_9GAMM|nr:DUF3053 domain-containing protein [Affinibrenneria salicis]KAA8997354.1 DUF3053 domain-containing protein [Affinibrenneria salicis]